PVGVAAAIRMMVKMPDGVRLIVHGLQRIRLVEPTQEDPYIRCRIEPMPEKEEFAGEDEVEVQALVRNISNACERVVQMSPNMPDELRGIPLNVRTPGILADLVGAHLPVGTPEKQEILEELDVRERLRKLAQLVQREL